MKSLTEAKRSFFTLSVHSTHEHHQLKLCFNELQEQSGLDLFGLLPVALLRGVPNHLLDSQPTAVCSTHYAVHFTFRGWALGTQDSVMIIGRVAYAAQGTTQVVVPIVIGRRPPEATVPGHSVGGNNVFGITCRTRSVNIHSYISVAAMLLGWCALR